MKPSFVGMVLTIVWSLEDIYYYGSTGNIIIRKKGNKFIKNNGNSYK